MTFKLKLREDLPATIEEHRALRQQVLLLSEALKQAREKLVLYRKDHSGIYIGGVEYTALIRQIDEALNSPTPR
jgi:hypothetical protein